MQTLLEDYADLLLKQGKNLKSLHISFDMESFELVEIIEEKAHKLGYNDICLQFLDDSVKINSIDEKAFHKYVLKTADFMYLETKKEQSFYERFLKQIEKDDLNIIHGLVPNKKWAKEKLGEENECYNKLLRTIIDNYQNIPCQEMVDIINQISFIKTR